MDNWLVIVIIIAAFALIIGNFSVVQQNANTPLRKQGLNDLEETLPRSHNKAHKMPTIVSAEPIESKEKKRNSHLNR
ncbi:MULTISPECIES: hypothetical protein [unclassified Colwellia]|jgi:hypothetical protein|uniref:hypothetical protein n=1 Tax=unclassified Colwellia TaxID=196834 RepID=UPI0015F42ACF|nr:MULTISPECIES: hypothetical protein [unclassified Colwellia]MBA6365446.1 hypothetical protein [Colwellia sp. BRX8-8]MBA6337141.1 hypothetical protein [Colwellia sp. BRX8-7]MBA6349238.1 hypothetical protein [Colwellia sp. BRX8-9]MBA6353045.1 hypothetical protein [Colwellia sp. BRX9-1]MBA6356115.1 hypothetical protein [Colwellia sp. BRX8-3]